jgi:hypothetical protein
VLGLGRADAPGQRAERALAAGVAVRADQRDAGKDDALLGRDDVNNALAGIADVEQADARGLRRLARGEDEVAAGGHDRPVGAAGQRIDDMVHRRERLPRRIHRAATFGQAFQCHAARPLMEQNAVDQQQISVVIDAIDAMKIPHFGEGCPRLHEFSFERTC